MTTPNEQAGTGKATCKTCGGTVPNHRPSVFDPDGRGNLGHKVEGGVPGYDVSANTEPHSELAPQTTPSKAVRDGFVRFARYCNSLSPRKLNEPLDPIVEGAIDDFITTTLTQHNEALLASIKKLRSEMAFADPTSARLAELVMTKVENRVASIIKGEKL